MSGSSSRVTTATDTREPTLAALLGDIVRDVVPTRFYQLLQLGIPFGIQFATMAWWRSAGWAFGAAAFGAWALSERALRCADDPANAPFPMRALRSMAASVAAAIPAVLMLELFMHLLGNSPVS